MNEDVKAPEQLSDSIWEIARRNPRMLAAIGAIAIYLLTFAAYWTSIRGEFIWDDDYYITNNTLLRSSDGLPQIWNPAEWLKGEQSQMRLQYYPLTLTSFWIEYQIWGNNPLGYKITNVLLHASSACLLWLILRRLKVRGAWAAAAVFALHPINVESVAWITERKNVLSGVFYFATMLVYMKYMEIRSRGGGADGALPKPEGQEEALFSLPEDETRVYALAIFLFACALLSKTVAATLPAAILLVIWWKRGRITWHDFLPLIPFFVLGIGMGALTGWIEREVIGAKGPEWDYAPTLMGEIGARCIIAGRAIWFYASKILFPVTLLFSYLRWNINPGAWWQYLFPLSVLGVLTSLWGLRYRIGRGPLVGILFFVGTLFPALGFVNVFPMQYSFVADHFAYLASIGLIVVIIASLARGIEQAVALNMLNVAAAPAAIVILLGALALRTSSQGMMYQNLRTLWETTLKGTGNKSPMASNNFGLWIMRNVKPEDLWKAEYWFFHTLELTSYKHPMAWFNLGLVAERRGHYDVAMERYKNSLALAPGYALAKHKIAEMHDRLGDRQAAIKAYQIIVEENPDSEVAHQNLAALLARENRNAEAIQHFAEVVRINPNSVLGHLGLAESLANERLIEEAIAAYGRVIQIDKNNAPARIGFGRIMMVMGRLIEAEAQFRLAIELDPKSAEAHYLLGVVLIQRGKYEEAVAPLTKATELAPQNTRMKEKLEETKDLAAHPEKRPATRPAMTTVPSTRPATLPTR